MLFRRVQNASPAIQQYDRENTNQFESLLASYIVQNHFYLIMRESLQKSNTEKQILRLEKGSRNGGKKQEKYCIKKKLQ